MPPSPILDFWWPLLWVSKPGWIHWMLSRLCNPQIHLWCNTYWLYRGQQSSRAFSIHEPTGGTASIGGGSGWFSHWTFITEKYGPTMWLQVTTLQNLDKNYSAYGFPSNLLSSSISYCVPTLPERQRSPGAITTLILLLFQAYFLLTFLDFFCRVFSGISWCQTDA